MTDNFASKRPVWKWVVITLFITLIGLWNFGIIMTTKMAYGRSIPFLPPFIDEMTGAYGVLLLLPFLLWFFKRFPLQRRNVVTHVPLYLLISVVFGVCHTLIMWVSRKVIYPLADIGNYDYGQWLYRVLMEYHKQFIIFWSVFGVVWLISYVRKNQEQRLKTVKLEQELTRARFQALQMQLNPHFLFNTLNMISSTMYENVKAADKMISYLSDLLRITLKNGSTEAYTLEKELELLTLYIEIMKARFRDKLIVRMDIDEQTRNALVPGFILQPLVENSIKYSMETLKTTEIRIISQKENDRLRLMVTDNGPGITEEAEEVMSHGVGLSNTVERLEKLYGTGYRFDWQNIEEGGKGLQVVIEIPYRILATKDTKEHEEEKKQRDANGVR